MSIKEIRAHFMFAWEGRLILTSPCYRGHYYPAPELVPEGEPHRPYIQIGDEVREGQPLCLIRESLLHRWQEYLVLSPHKGVIVERTAELEHLFRVKGFEEFNVLIGGFRVGMGASLFTLQMI